MKRFKILALGLVLSQAAAFAGATTVVLSTGNTFESFGGDLSSLVYLSNTIKINDRYSVIPETRSDFTWTEGGKGAVGGSHTYLRVLLRDNAIARLGEWKMAIMYRYTLPTTLALQEAGSFGTLAVRPEISRAFGNLSLLGRWTHSLGLLRNRYQFFTPSRGADAHDGNVLYSHAFEFLPSFKLNEQFSLNMNWTVDGSYKLAAQGSTESSFKHRFYHAYGVAYSSPAIWDMGIEVGVDHGPSTFGDGFQIWSKKGTYYVELSKVF